MIKILLQETAIIKIEWKKFLSQFLAIYKVYYVNKTFKMDKITTRHQKILIYKNSWPSKEIFYMVICVQTLLMEQLTVSYSQILNLSCLYLASPLD